MDALRRRRIVEFVPLGDSPAANVTAPSQRTSECAAQR